MTILQNGRNQDTTNSPTSPVKAIPGRDGAKTHYSTGRCLHHRDIATKDTLNYSLCFIIIVMVLVQI
jgi:hypothetical protein